MKNLFLFSILLSVFFACGNEADNAASAAQEAQMKAQAVLADEAMKVHDAVMPKMREVGELQRQIETLVTTAEDKISDATKEQAMSVAQTLERADQSMNNWMQNIPFPDKLREAGDTHEVIMAKLERSNNAAKEMSSLVERALVNGRATVESLKNQVEG